MGTKPELHQSPELADAHWQLIVGLKSQTTRPARPMIRAVRGDTRREREIYYVHSASLAYEEDGGFFTDLLTALC